GAVCADPNGSPRRGNNQTPVHKGSEKEKRMRKTGPMRRHRRFTLPQLQELERVFQRNHYLSDAEAWMKRRLAICMGVTEAKVQRWFWKRREQYRREPLCLHCGFCGLRLDKHGLLVIGPASPYNGMLHIWKEGRDNTRLRTFKHRVYRTLKCTLLSQSNGGQLENISSVQES
ncbi:Rhox homeobox family member 2, partial [Sigmodon hispidus]